MADLFRSKELAKKYKTHRDSGMMDRGCVLCKAEPIQTFKHWKVIPNLFPYDLVAKTHHMLITLRHVKDSELNSDEIEELAEIKADYVQQYDYIQEATNRTKSIPQHFHLHLIIGKQLGT